MDSMPKVSVIIPVYNAAPYLRQCLDSILGQSLREFEVICVDDGSTDDSVAILEEYAAHDDRLLVMRQRNQYAGVARNAGMAVARGEFLVFWDADDYFDPTALEKMHCQIVADESDVCVCGGKRFYEGENLEVGIKDYLNPKRIPKQVPFNRFTNPDYIINFTCEAPWNKMFRKSFIEKHQLRFQPRRNGNDVYFVACALCLAQSITVVREQLVCYRKNRPDSTVGTLSQAPYAPLLSWIDVRNRLMQEDALPEVSFENKALGVVIYCLNNLDTWDAFCQWYDFLEERGLDELGLKLRDRSFYQLTWRYDFLFNLLQMSKEDFFAYFAHWNYLQSGIYSARYKEVSQRMAKYRECEKELNAVKASRSYRVGRAVTAPVRLLKRFARRLSH